MKASISMRLVVAVAAMILVISCSPGGGGGGGGEGGNGGPPPAGPPGSVSGQVTGSPEMGITFPEGAEVSIEGHPEFATTTDSDGNFQFDNIPPGEYTLSITGVDNSGKESTLHQTIVVVGGNEVNLGRLNIVQTGAIMGTIALSDGANPLGALIYIPGTSFDARADDTGYFIIIYIPQGSYRVRVEAGGNYVPEEVLDVVVTKGDVTDIGTITLIIDSDNDGWADGMDNCPLDSNSLQLDGDTDGIGDICDNCPSLFNPDQTDGNGNGVGDTCEIQCPNYSMEFDGTDDYISVPNSSSFVLNNKATIESWVKLDRCHQAVVIGKLRWGAEDKSLVITATCKLRIQFYSILYPNWPTSSASIPVSQWTHIAATYNGSSTRLFINGAQVASRSVSGDIRDSQNGIFIGRRNKDDGSIIYFDGLMDEVRWWNVARTQQQIQDNMYRELTGNESGLMGYWNFNEGSGQEVADSSGNANNGRIGGSYDPQPSDPVWVNDSPLTSADSDGDCIPDDNEIIHSCLDAQTYDSHLDYDQDGISNFDEQTYNTDPCNPDTDFDNLSDSFEIFYPPTPFTCMATGDCETQSGCSVDSYGGHNYLFCNRGAAWIEAQDFCRSYGGDLAAIGDSAEDSWVYSNLTSLGTWIGLNDVDVEGKFAWSHGSPFTYVNWWGWEPDNSGNQDCGCFWWGMSNQWSDGGCTINTLHFICEDGFALNPFSSDSDGDGLTDGDEVKLYGTHPNIPDTDGDGLSDYDEALIHGTDPASSDTDADGLPDVWEVLYSCVDAMAGDSQANPDGDAFINLEEYALGYDPCTFAECSDGIDNDGDSVLDFPEDPGCVSPGDSSEYGDNACDDGLDNDADGLTDWPDDPDCIDALDTAELKPILISEFSTLNECHYVVVRDNLAYIANWSAGISIVDVSDPYSPNLIGSLNTSGYSSGLYIRGDYLFVADWNPGLKVINISDPTSPFLEASYDTPGISRRIYLKNGYSYLADRAGGLNIVDISNPTSPIYIGGYDTTGEAFDVITIGDYAYISETTVGLKIFNISNPSSPSVTGTYSTTGSASGLDARGNYAYLASGGYGTKIININDPQAPASASIFSTQDAVREVYLIGSYAFSANGLLGIQIINISDPLNPILAGSCDTSGKIINLVTRGNYAYMAGWGSRLLSIIDINATDSDNDGMPNYWELYHSSCMHAFTIDNPDGDYDSDYLTNYKEFELNLDPCTAEEDLDGDSIHDWWEWENICMDADTADNFLDYDSDQLNNKQEYLARTDPCESDTDGDGLDDGDEVNVYTTNPNLLDTDGDGLSDGDEILIHGTDPTLPDSDGDLIPDGWEVTYTSSCGLNPLAGDSMTDGDTDGLFNLGEYIAGTDPCNPDTDGDGLLDGEEVNTYLTDPLNPDTDGGGVPDGVEVSSNRSPHNPWDENMSSDITIGADAGQWTYPFATVRHDARTQVIYLASEIGGAGGIPWLALDVAALPDGGMDNFTIRLKHTALSTYSVASWEGPGSGWTVVYQNNETISLTGWHYFAFSSSFPYNGIDNLLVDFSFNKSASAFWNGNCLYSIPGGNRSIYYRINSSYGDPLDWTGTSNPMPLVTNIVPNIKINLDLSSDSDGDGMVDAWEDQYACVDTLVGDSLENPDGDAFSNLDEHYWYTDPCNPD